MINREEKDQELPVTIIVGRLKGVIKWKEELVSLDVHHPRDQRARLSNR